METFPVAQPTDKVRVQDLKPGMKVERLTRDLDFTYVEVAEVQPVKAPVSGGSPRTVSYRVLLSGYLAGSHQDSCLRPFIVRPSQRLDVLKEA